MEFLNYFSNVFTFANIVILILGTIGGLLMGAAVFATKCEHYGEKIEAGIVLKKNQKVTENDLIKHCENLVGKFKSPDKVYFFQNCLKDHQEKYKDLKFRNKLNEKLLGIVVLGLLLYSISFVLEMNVFKKKINVSFF
jgi:hypothetical protein